MVHCDAGGVPCRTLVSSVDNLWRSGSLCFCAHCAPSFVYGGWIFWNRKSNFFGGMYERLERLCSEGFWVQFTLFSIKWLGLHMPEHVDYVTVFRFPKLHVVVCPH